MRFELGPTFQSVFATELKLHCQRFLRTPCAALLLTGARTSTLMTFIARRRRRRSSAPSFNSSFRVSFFYLFPTSHSLEKDMLNHRLLLLFPSVTALATDRRQVVSKSSLFSSPTTTTNQSFTIQTSLPNNSSSISTTSRGDSSRTIATTAVTANVAAASASPVLGQRAVHGLPYDLL